MTRSNPLDRQSGTSWRLIPGDCIEVMATLPEASVDSIVCDPPYGLGFMGKEWDSPGGTGNFPMRRTDATNTVNTGASRQGGRQRASEDFLKRQARDARSYQAWCEEWGKQARRVLRPGGYILAFSGTRTYHRLGCGLEDAGFEVRDMVAWLYGSGFPKHASCLKPAHEPVFLGRKAAPKSEALQIDVCRIGMSDDDREAMTGRSGVGKGATSFHQIGRDEGTYEPHSIGRWPANVTLDEEAAVMLDEQTGETVGGNSVGPRPTSYSHDTLYEGGVAKNRTPFDYGDSGGASRFLYVAKPDQAERNVGLHGQRNPHPTVKPVDYMRWLCRLITPPGGTVLDPFTGSGTTGIAALREGFSFIGIEREAEYIDVARARIVGDAPLINSVLEEAA